MDDELFNKAKDFARKCYVEAYDGVHRWSSKRPEEVPHLVAAIALIISNRYLAEERKEARQEKE